MVALLALMSKINNLRLLRVLNSLIGILVGVNDNEYSSSPHNKLIYFFLLILLFLSVKLLPMNMDGVL